MLHRIEYTPLALDQLRDLARHERRIVLDAVDEFLTHEPEKESKSQSSACESDIRKGSGQNI
ncbi:MAG: type II toxin-antitoxin system RelE family toxin [Verrucomicrobiales bacterium]